MAEEEKDKMKKELLSVARDVENVASAIAAKGREAVRQGEFLGDVVKYTRQFIETVPDDGFFSQDTWKAQTGILQAALQRAEIYNGAMNDATTLALSADSTATSSVVIVTSGAVASLPPEVREAGRKAYEGLERILEGSNIRNDIDAEIARLGLTTMKGKETISSLLCQAEQAFTTPSGGQVAPAAVLIPLREAIDQAYAVLLQRRPNQEPAKGDSAKVKSICQQCKDASVDVAQIEFLVSEAPKLKDQLSGAKDNLLSRDEVRELLNKGLIYLRTFLRIIDAKKLK